MKNKRYITINESTFNRLFLLEDTRSDQAIERSLIVIRNFFENKNPFARWIRNGAWDLDAPFVHPDNPKRLSNLDYMFGQFEENFFHSPDLRKSAIRRLEPSFAQMAFEAGFQQAQFGAHDIKKQNRIKRIIWKMFYSQEKEKAVEGMSQDELERINLENKKAAAEGKKISEFPSTVIPIKNENEEIIGYNFQLTPYDTLNEIYGRQIDEDDAAETERIDSTQYVKNGSYNVIGPLSYNAAHKYAELSGDKQATETKICYGMFEGTWEDYTFEDKFKVYIALRNDWQQVQPTITKEKIDAEREAAKAEGRKPNVQYPSAYDDYGMSMIWVIIDDDGNLATCNTRWNHLGIYKKGRSVDWALTREEISDVIGRNFMQEFRYDKETVDDVSDDDMAVNVEQEDEFNESCFADEETIREADEETLAVIRNYVDNGESWDEVFNDEENYQGLTNLQFVKYQFDSLFFNEENLNRSIVVRFKPLFCQVALENGFIESENDPTFREETARPIATVIWNLFNIANTSEEYAAQINEIPNDVSYDELANYAERTINEIENASNNGEY